MSRRLPQFEFFLYNFSSILCLKFENENYQVSNLATFLSILRMPILISMTCIIALNPLIKNTIVQESLVILKNYSVFSRVSIILVAVSLYVTTFIYCISQAIRRYKVRNFIRSFVAKSLEEKYFLKYKSCCFKHSLMFVILVLIVEVLSFFGAFKMSIWSIFALLAISQPFIIFIIFAFFVTNFENFVVASLKQFRKELKRSKNLPCLKRGQRFENYLRLSKIYQEIYDLVEQFNDCFGPQMTLLIVHMISMTIFSVSF